MLFRSQVILKDVSSRAKKSSSFINAREPFDELNQARFRYIPNFKASISNVKTVHTFIDECVYSF